MYRFWKFDKSSRGNSRYHTKPACEAEVEDARASDANRVF
jgi:hypothetical protein